MSWGHAESNPFALDFDTWMPIVTVALLREGATIVFNRFYESTRFPANQDPKMPSPPEPRAEEVAAQRRGKSRVQLYHEELVDRHIRAQVSAARPIAGNPRSVTVRFNEAMLYRMVGFCAGLIAEHQAAALPEGSSASEAWEYSRTARLLTEIHTRLREGLQAAMNDPGLPPGATPADAASTSKGWWGS